MTLDARAISLADVLPERITAARKLAGLTQQTAAERAGVAAAQWGRYEHGHVTPSIGTLERIAAALGTTAADLLRGEP